MGFNDSKPWKINVLNPQSHACLIQMTFRISIGRTVSGEPAVVFFLGVTLLVSQKPYVNLVNNVINYQHVNW